MIVRAHSKRQQEAEPARQTTFASDLNKPIHFDPRFLADA
jgi:hypothetical protein